MGIEIECVAGIGVRVSDSFVEELDDPWAPEEYLENLCGEKYKVESAGNFLSDEDPMFYIFLKNNFRTIDKKVEEDFKNFLNSNRIEYTGEIDLYKDKRIW